MKMKSRHPVCVFDGKYHYLRQDFVVKACKDIAKIAASDFKKNYIKKNIEEASANGEDVDVRLEENIASMNAKNIRVACESIGMYFDECIKKGD